MSLYIPKSCLLNENFVGVRIDCDDILNTAEQVNKSEHNEANCEKKTNKTFDFIHGHDDEVEDGGGKKKHRREEKSSSWCRKLERTR